MLRTCYSCKIVITLLASSTDFSTKKKTQILNFTKIPPVEAKLQYTDGRKDIMNESLSVIFANALKNITEAK
jgi:hypothetical protein